MWCRRRTTRSRSSSSSSSSGAIVPPAASRPPLPLELELELVPASSSQSPAQPPRACPAGWRALFARQRRLPAAGLARAPRAPRAPLPPSPRSNRSAPWRRPTLRHSLLLLAALAVAVVAAGVTASPAAAAEPPLLTQPYHQAQYEQQVRDLIKRAITATPDPAIDPDLDQTKVKGGMWRARTASRIAPALRFMPGISLGATALTVGVAIGGGIYAKFIAPQTPTSGAATGFEWGHTLTNARQKPADGLRTAAWALLFCSFLYAVPHLYWGLGGTEAHFVYKPSASQQSSWEAAHLFAFALISFAGLLGFALERVPGPSRWRLALLFIVGAGAAVATSHGLYGIAFRAASVLGLTEVEGVPFDIEQHGWVLWDLLAIEPWFLGEGLLLGLAGYFTQSSARGRRVWLLGVSTAFLFFLVTAMLSVTVG